MKTVNTVLKKLQNVVCYSVTFLQAINSEEEQLGSICVQKFKFYSMYAIDICHQNMRKQILNSSRRNIHIRITAFLDTGINILYKKSVKKNNIKMGTQFSCLLGHY